MANTKPKMRILHASFIVLSIAGFGLLWGSMFLNGTLNGMTAVKELGYFPDGRPLRSTYTGLPLLDSPVTTLVIFFDGVTNGLDPGPRLLMVDLSVMLQSQALWSLIESRRIGNRFMLLSFPAIWGLLWNGFGAAIFLPIYCFIHLQNTPANRDNALPVNEAKASTATIALGTLFPLILMLPPLLNCSIARQQAFMALFHTTPIMFVTIQYITAYLISLFQEKTNRTDADKPFVIRSYTLAGICSAAAHVYALAVSLFAQDPATAFSRVYIPRPANVDPLAPNKITEGAHLFLQFDWIVINLTCVLYAYLLLEPHLATFKFYLPKSWEKQAAMLLIGLTTIVLGPGAAVSSAFALREGGLRKGNVAVKKG